MRSSLPSPASSRGSACTPTRHSQRLVATPSRVASRKDRLSTCRCKASDDNNDEAGSRSGNERASSSVPDSLPVAAPDADWRDFRARLVRMNASESPSPDTPSGWWAHSVPKPETGCVLVSHPSMFTKTQTYFFQSVIFILEHNETKGSAGVILNRPSEYTLKEGDLPLDLQGFSDCLVYVGGDVPGGGTVMHSDPTLEGSIEVIKGICISGETAGSQAITKGEKKPEDFRWFMNYAGWGPGQLEKEVSQGVWFTAAASPNLILSPPSALPPPPPSALALAPALGLGSSHAGAGTTMWLTVLELMGGDHAKLAELWKAIWAEDAKQAAGVIEEGNDRKKFDAIWAAEAAKAEAAPCSFVEDEIEEGRDKAVSAEAAKKVEDEIKEESDKKDNTEPPAPSL